VDLNSDVGESFGAWRMGDDAALLPSVTSANVACGFHAGDPTTARRTCAVAVRHGVVVGAHVAYRDLAGFGRRFLDVAGPELTDDVVYQIGALQAVAAASGTTVRYVKPHGALYTAVITHETQARAVVEAILAVDPGLPLVTMPGRAARLAGEAGVRVVLEGFPDRAYTAGGGLVPRRHEGAVVHDPAEVARRAIRMAQGEVVAEDGTVVAVDVETLCVHGDTPQAVATAAAVRAGLDEAGIAVESFL
jgi:5-oxoprolinase (ATP-hydrolysing) subunit A